MLQSFIALECPSLCKLQVNYSMENFFHDYSVLFHRSAWGTGQVHALMIFCDRVVGEQVVPKKENYNYKLLALDGTCFQSEIGPI